MSCEDQALVPTDHCTKWGCDKAKLVKRGGFWICPKCEGSYGCAPTKGKPRKLLRFGGREDPETLYKTTAKQRADLKNGLSTIAVHADDAAVRGMGLVALTVLDDLETAFAQLDASASAPAGEEPSPHAWEVEREGPEFEMVYDKPDADDRRNKIVAIRPLYLHSRSPEVK